MENQKKGLNISTKSFISALVVIFALMVLTYIITLVVPGGSYARIMDANGNLVIDQAAGFTAVEGGIPFWKWILSPVLVLGAEGSTTVIAVIIFLIVMGGAFNCLEKCGLMRYMLDKLTDRYGSSRYKLQAIIILFFMGMGSLIGSFEECVPLVPIVVALAVSLGWDTLTGIGMSLLAVGCGFAAGVCNPFTVGVAQQLAGLPMFSGAAFRFLNFVLIFLLLWTFIRTYSKKIEKPVGAGAGSTDFRKDPKMDKGLLSFVLILGTGIVLVFSSAFLPFLQDYTMIIVAIMFLFAGLVSSRISGMTGKKLGATFLNGSISILPAVLMILMATSIRYTLEEAHVMDSLLHSVVGVAGTLPKWAVILFIYIIALVMNFFIASGSAKAFMLIPLIIPVAQIFGISSQLCIVAYAFGDGFSNVIYPTNPVLLISLGMTGESYGSWFRWSIRFQLLNLLLTAGLLLLGLVIGV